MIQACQVSSRGKYYYKHGDHPPQLDIYYIDSAEWVLLAQFKVHSLTGTILDHTDDCINSMITISDLLLDLQLATYNLEHSCTR